MKVISIVGARPQLVKLAPIAAAFATTEHEHVIVHTGQHYDADLSDVFFEGLGIPDPDVHLGVGSGSHGMQTGAVLSALDPVLDREKPDWVLVYGDTNSTIAGALSAVKMHLPVAHLEAGLRSFNRRMPEEHNRVLTDHCADLLLAPTEEAMRHLAAEGLADRAVLAGDVMVDICLRIRDTVLAGEHAAPALPEGIDPAQPFLLATLHRPDNTDDPERLAAILDSLAALPLPVALLAHPVWWRGPRSTASSWRRARYTSAVRCRTPAWSPPSWPPPASSPTPGPPEGGVPAGARHHHHPAGNRVGGNRGQWMERPCSRPAHPVRRQVGRHGHPSCPDGRPGHPVRRRQGRTERRPDHGRVEGRPPARVTRTGPSTGCRPVYVTVLASPDMSASASPGSGLPASGERPHVIYLAIGFPPAAKSCAYRMRETANQFVNQGWDVTVVTIAQESWERDSGVDPTLLEQVDPQVRIVELPLSREDLETDIRLYDEARALNPNAWVTALRRRQMEPFPEPNFGDWREDLEQAVLRIHRSARPISCWPAASPT